MNIKKILLIISLIALVSCSGLSTKQQDAANEALKSLRKLAAATEVGVNYQNYGQLLIDAKAKVNEVKSLLPEGEIKEHIDKAMEAYADAGQVWGEKISNQGYFWGFGEKEALIDKYSLPTKLQPVIGNRVYDGGLAIQVIWAEASAHLGEASKLFENN